MRKIKLFCLPYAGGTATIYSTWKRYASSIIEICPVELAGRGRRYCDAFYGSIDKAVDDVFGLISDDINDCDYAILGHSMGALIAYELINKIIDLKYRHPIHAFFSGRYPPHISKLKQPIHVLNDNLLVNEVLRYDGTQKEIFENEEALKIFLPIIRADFRILENWQYSGKRQRYNFDISVFGGKDDFDVTEDDLNEWDKYTLGSCNVYKFDGGHFFINKYVNEIMDIVNSALMDKY